MADKRKTAELHQASKPEERLVPKTVAADKPEGRIVPHDEPRKKGPQLGDNTTRRGTVLEILLEHQRTTPQRRTPAWRQRIARAAGAAGLTVDA